MTGGLNNAGVEAVALLDELLDGPSKGAFYGIGAGLRSKLETVRLTLKRGFGSEEWDTTLCSHPGPCVDNMHATGGAFCANLTSLTAISPITTGVSEVMLRAGLAEFPGNGFGIDFDHLCRAYTAMERARLDDQE